MQKTVSSTFIITAAFYHRPVIQPTAYMTTIKRNEFSIFTQIKTLHYLESIFAMQDNRQFREDIVRGLCSIQKALLLKQVLVTYSFVVINRKILIPKRADGILLH